MTAALLAIAWTLVALLVIVAMVAAVRWAKKASRVASAVGGTLILLLGAAFVPPAEQTRLEEAKEPKGKKGAESGDPPA
jgi:hypothetical protein